MLALLTGKKRWAAIINTGQSSYTYTYSCTVGGLYWAGWPPRNLHLRSLGVNPSPQADGCVSCSALPCYYLVIKESAPTIWPADDNNNIDTQYTIDFAFCHSGHSTVTSQILKIRIFRYYLYFINSYMVCFIVFYFICVLKLLFAY